MASGLPEGWEKYLEAVEGKVYRGVERIATGAILDGLGCTDNHTARLNFGKLLKPHMQRLGWRGPKHMRFMWEGNGREEGTGYWRMPRFNSLMQGIVAEDGRGTPNDELSEELEAVTRLGLNKMGAILRQPLIMDDHSRTRNQVTAAIGAVNAQLRADEARLKAKVRGDVLERLLKIIAEEKAKREQRRLRHTSPLGDNELPSLASSVAALGSEDTDGAQGEASERAAASGASEPSPSGTIESK
jgi:hypothetical protein